MLIWWVPSHDPTHYLQPKILRQWACESFSLYTAHLTHLHWMWNSWLHTWIPTNLSLKCESPDIANSPSTSKVFYPWVSLTCIALSTNNVNCWVPRVDMYQGELVPNMGYMDMTSLEPWVNPYKRYLTSFPTKNLMALGFMGLSSYIPFISLISIQCETPNSILEFLTISQVWVDDLFYNKCTVLSKVIICH